MTCHRVRKIHMAAMAQHLESGTFDGYFASIVQVLTLDSSVGKELDAKCTNTGTRFFEGYDCRMTEFVVEVMRRLLTETPVNSCPRQ